MARYLLFYYILDAKLLQLFKCFNHLGLCQGVGPTRKNIDAVVCETNATLKEWKRLVEVEYLSVCYVVSKKITVLILLHEVSRN